MKTFTGIPASGGLAVGKAFVYPYDETPYIPRYSITEYEAAAEWERLQKALAKAEAEVKSLHERASREMSR